MSNRLLKKERPFELHAPQYGEYGGGTQPAKYFDKNGKEVPYKKTKWFKLSKKKD